MRPVACALALTIVAAAVPVCAADGEVTLAPETIAADGRFWFLPRYRSPALPRWALALGGGAAWGPAHLGFVMAAADDGLVPDLVAGTSAGALVGADIAAGYGPERSLRLLEESDFGRKLFAPAAREGAGTTFDPLSEENAIVRTGVDRDGGELHFRGVLPDRLVWTELTRYLAHADALAAGDMDRLAIPLRAVSTDLATGASFAPREGRLVRAVRASISLPVLAPVAWGGRVLVDGGTVERVPAPTARAMGAEVVVAVELTEDGRPLGSRFDASSLSGLLFRTFDVAAAVQRDATLAEADVVAQVRLGGASLSTFSGNLDKLLAAGRTAWGEVREATLAALEKASPDRRRFRLVRVEAAAGTDPLPAQEIERSLGLAAGERDVSALRCELALVAAMRRHDGSSGSIAIGADGVARLRLEREPEVRRIEVTAPPPLDRFLHPGRFAPEAGERPARALLRVQKALDEARRAGYFLAEIDEVSWGRATGRLAVKFGAGPIVRFELGDGRAAPRGLVALEGSAGRIDTLERALLRLEAREALRAPLVGSVLRQAGPAYVVAIESEPPPRRVTTAALGLADTLGPTFWVSVSRPAPEPGAVTFETRAVAGGEGLAAGFEVRRPRVEGFVPFARAGIARPRLPVYDPFGWRTGGRSFRTAAVAAGLGWGPGALGSVETALVAHHASRGAFPTSSEGATGVDTVLEARWKGDFRDAPFLPSRGLAWSLGAAVPLAGEDRPAIVSGDLEGHAPLGASGRYSIGALVRAAWASNDDPLPLDRWSEAGAWAEAPPLSPGQSRSPDLRRASVVFRARLGKFPRSPVALGASVSRWRLGALRADPALERDGRGAAVFLEVATPRLGSATLGVAHGSERGDALFFVLGPARFSWPAFGAALPGR